MLTNQQFEKFQVFAKSRENVDFNDLNTKLALDYAKPLVRQYLKGLEQYFDHETFESLVFNLLLHEMIASSFLCELHEKYDMANKQFFIGSVSAAGLSSSVENFATLGNAKLFFQDLYRTPYGRLAYSFLESIQGSAVVIL